MWIGLEDKMLFERKRGRERERERERKRERERERAQERQRQRVTERQTSQGGKSPQKLSEEATMAVLL